MRVSDNMKFNSMIGNIFTVQNDYNNIMEKMSSQKEINRPSDDPAGMIRILDLREMKSCNEQYSRNIKAADSWLSLSESKLSAVGDLISKARGLAIGQATATASQTGRKLAAGEIQSLTDEMLSLANSTLNGKYLFSGTATETPPFSYSGGYSGNNQALSVEIQKDSRVAYNLAGQEVFTSDGMEGVDIFECLTDLKTAMQNNDQDGIHAQIGNLEKAQNQIAFNVSRCGTRINRLVTAQSNLTDLDLKIKELTSNVEDADITELATQLAMKQVTLQACYSLASKIENTSILNFLK